MKEYEVTLYRLKREQGVTAVRADDKEKAMQAAVASAELLTQSPETPFWFSVEPEFQDRPVVYRIKELGKC